MTDAQVLKYYKNEYTQHISHYMTSLTFNFQQRLFTRFLDNNTKLSINASLSKETRSAIILIFLYYFDLTSFLIFNRTFYSNDFIHSTWNNWKGRTSNDNTEYWLMQTYIWILEFRSCLGVHSMNLSHFRSSFFLSRFNFMLCFVLCDCFSNF